VRYPWARDHSREQTNVLRQKLKAEKIIDSYPQYGVLSDRDAYLEDLPISGVSISDFINASYEDFAVVKKVVLAKHVTQEVTDV
jgi:hypothetical protein